jgi:catechol 2,3-dioxygenase-like lactoylglutathione lyase family enzyme
MSDWYARPVFFVADLERAERFYVDRLGFAKKWHEADGAGTVCQVERDGCEIILCQDVARRDRGRVFISLTAEALAELRRTVPAKETWWGYDCLQVEDPDGNELLFPASSA